MLLKRIVEIYWSGLAHMSQSMSTVLLLCYDVVRATVGNEGSIDIARLTSLLHSHRLSPPSLTEVDFQPVEIEHHNNDPENLPSLGQPYQLLSQVGVSRELFFLL